MQINIQNLNSKSVNEIVNGLSELLPEYKPSIKASTPNYGFTNHEAEA